MDSNGRCFLGNWTITQWTPDTHGVFPPSLVQTGGVLTIAPAGESFRLQWKDQDNKPCTVTPDLNLKIDEATGILYLEVNSSNAAGKVEVGPPQASIPCAAASVKLQVVVSFGDIGTGPTGTFVAEAQPVGGPPISAS